MILWKKSPIASVLEGHIQKSYVRVVDLVLSLLLVQITSYSYM